MRVRAGAAVGGVLAVAALAGCSGAGSTTGPTTASVAAPASSVVHPGARDHPMHPAAFGPVFGSGCPVNGSCGCGGATGLAQEFDCQMDHLAVNDIPVTAYLFDGSAWSKAGSGAANTCAGPDCCSWNLGDVTLSRLARSGVRGLLHFWGGCHDEEQYRRASDRLGRNLLGFYLDDGSSDHDLEEVSEFMQGVDPGDWECFAKAFQNRQPSTSDAALARWANVAYVGDLPHDYSGLREGVARILAKAPFVPAPLAELTGYAYLDPLPPAEDVYYRRLHFGALQPVMAHTPFANSDPWRPEYRPDLVRAYRYWAWLHKELVPFFYSHALRMYEDPGQPVLRAGPMPDSWQVGDELFAPFVTEPVDALDIALPAGEWVDWWDATRVASGTLPAFPVPLGREPVFVRLGALLPMDVQRPTTGHGTVESRGSLTVLVYPRGTSSFRYRADAASTWVTLTSTLSGSGLTLSAEPGLPGRPLLYRVERWPEAPDTVGLAGSTVSVNQGSDRGLPRLDSEAAVNGSRESAWFHDAQARRLVVKVIP